MNVLLGKYYRNNNNIITMRFLLCTLHLCIGCLHHVHVSALLHALVALCPSTYSAGSIPDSWSYSSFPLSFRIHIASDEHPFLGASPDAVVYDPDTDDPFGSAEIKCPYSVHLITPAEACSRKDFCSTLPLQALDNIT